MKKTFATGLSVLLLAACSSAQKTDRADGKAGKEIPPVVEAAFKKDFPNMDDVDWEKEGDNYEAEFENGNVEMSVVYNASGILQETETIIEPEELPKAVQDYLAVNHKGQKIKEAAKIVDREGSVKYEAEVKGKDLLFDVNGKLVKTVEE